MADNDAKKDDWLHWVAPWLVAPAAALSYFAANKSYFTFLNPLVSIAAGLILTAVVVFAFSKLTRSATKSAICSTLLLLLFFFVVPIHDHAETLATKKLHRLISNAFLFGFVPCLTLGGIVLAIRSKSLHKDLSRVFSIFVLCLLIPNLLSWIGTIRPQVKTISKTENPTGQSGEHPDIFYIIPDGYPRQDSLFSYFGYDNHPFLSELNSRGFFVATNSHSNYPQTALSVASCLNLDYLDRLIPDEARGTENRQILYDLIHTNRFVTELNNIGYEIAHVETGYKATKPFALTDHSIFPPQDGLVQNEFFSHILKRTLLRPFLKKQLNRSFDEHHRMRMLHGLDSMKEYAEDDAPSFVFAHLVCPHPPFVLAEESIRELSSTGTIFDHKALAREVGISPEDFAEGYRQQITGINDLFVKTIDEIEANAKRPYIIIIHADHGSSLIADIDHPVEEASKVDCYEKYSILLSVKTSPGISLKPNHNLNPINLNRLVLNSVTGSNLPQLDDKSIYASWFDVFSFKDITHLRTNSLLIQPDN